MCRLATVAKQLFLELAPYLNVCLCTQVRHTKIVLHILFYLFAN